MAADPTFPEGFFERIDKTADSGFYRMPRFVTHIDPETITALTECYRELLPAGGSVLDLMSSWVSHLPREVAFDRVAGLGMNQEELDGNSRLDDVVVHDLNQDPELPYPNDSFDAILNAVSVQYLTRPVEVFRSAARVLRPGGVHIVAMSHRCFPTKAIRAFQALDGTGRCEVVEQYFALAGGYRDVGPLDRSPRGADPLWLVVARRA
jgi:SAM-dependent methyltransferase